MYKIYVGDYLLYDSSDKDTYPATELSVKLALRDAGSVEFTLLPGHPYYEQVKQWIHKPMKVLRGTDEIFYGRLLTYQKDFLGNLKLYGEGALTFLLDSEMPKGKYTESVSAFLNRCISAHNSQVGAAKRFGVGTVRSDKASAQNTFEISSWTQVKSVLETQLLSQYGGFFRITPNGSGGHNINYYASGSSVNTQLIKIGDNVITKEDKASGENIFTALRPIGAKDTVTLNDVSQSSVTIPNCTLSGGVLYLNDLIAKYDKIVHTETFSGIENKIELLRIAEEYITKRRSKLPAVCDVNYVEFHYINPSLPFINIGNRFTNIEGFEGAAMTVTDQTIDLEDPSNDELTLKNDEEMENDNPSSRGRNASSISSKGGRGGGGGGIGKLAAETFNYITQTEKRVEINTENIQITADDTLQLSGKVTYLTSGHNMFITAYDDPQHPGKLQIGVARKLDDGTGQAPGGEALFTFDNARIGVADPAGKRKLGMDEVDTIMGSQFWSSRDQLVAINGHMYVGQDGKMHVVEGSGLMLDKANGVSLGYYNNDNLTAGIVVNKINGGSVKIKAAKIELDGYVTASQLSAVSADIATLRTDITTGMFIKATDLVCSGNFTYKSHALSFYQFTDSEGRSRRLLGYAG